MIVSFGQLRKGCKTENHNHAFHVHSISMEVEMDQELYHFAPTSRTLSTVQLGLKNLNEFVSGLINIHFYIVKKC